jgi:hypothetical protein
VGRRLNARPYCGADDLRLYESLGFRLHARMVERKRSA